MTGAITTLALSPSHIAVAPVVVVVVLAVLLPRPSIGQQLPARELS